MDQLPQGELCQYGLKLDGYRTIANQTRLCREVDLFSRNGISFNSKFPSTVKMLEEFAIKAFYRSGEIVALDEQGRHSFALLQKTKTSKAALRFYIFHLLYIDNTVLAKTVLQKRRTRLGNEFFALAKHVQLLLILFGKAHEGFATEKIRI